MDWVALVNEKCDLDLAFESLEGWDHFHTDTIRGRIRSLQLRPKEAWRFFRKAEERAGIFCRSPLNDLRRFFLKSYRFENALVDESGGDGVSPADIEECVETLLAGEDPDSEVAVQLREFDHGLFRLHREDYAEAKKIFRHLVDVTSDRIVDQQAGFFIGLAAAHSGLGEMPEADRQAENACLSVLAVENAFTRGLFASTLAAVFGVWRRDREAREWKEFIERLKVPPKTTEIFRERTRRIIERSIALQRVFLI